MSVRQLALGLAACVLAGLACDDSKPATAAADAPSAASPPPKSAKKPVSKPATVEAVAWTKISTKTDDAAVVRKAVADATGVPVVYIGAVWCGPCKQYKAALTDPRMIEAHTGAHIIELDADKHTKSLGELGIRPMGVPHWEMVDKTGTPVGRTIDGSHWEANTPENMAPALGRFFGLGHG